MKTKNALVNLVVVAAMLISNLAWAPVISSAASSAVIEENTLAVILYVKAGGAGDCSTWANACELQSALDVAAEGDDIWVAQGVYTPTMMTDPGDVRTATFQLVNGVALYGGFPATGDPGFGERNWETNVTVLSGDIDGDDITDSNGVVTDTINITGANSYHVLMAEAVNTGTILDGFTVTAGNANGASPYFLGGGMYNAHSSPNLTDVVFSGNAAIAYGGGMENWYGSPSLTDVAFNGNTAGAYGGGMRNYGATPTLTGATFSRNSAGMGGGMYNDIGSAPSLTNVNFSENEASGNGGGMYNGGISSSLTDVTFSGNTAGASGGGMYNSHGSHTLNGGSFSENTAGQGAGMYNSYSSPTLSGVNFSDNDTALYGWGGGMYNYIDSSPVMTDVVFYSNSSNGGFGGGMANFSNSNPVLTNVIFTYNLASDGGGMYNRENSHPTLNGGTFAHNYAWVGAGMLNTTNSNPALTDVTFDGNFAYGKGGGVLNWASSNPTLQGVILRGNTAVDAGGGMHNEANSNPVLVNVLFSGNRTSSASGGMGGGMYNDNSSPELINVTFNANTAADTAASLGGGMANVNYSNPKLYNTLVWGNSSAGQWDEIYDDGTSQGSGPYCSVRLGYSSCTIQDEESPFVDADGADNLPGTADDDLRLVYTSNAIDGGSNTLVPIDITLDLGGARRFYTDYDLDGSEDGRDDQNHPNQVDLGAYEAQCYPWHMRYAGPKLEAGREYRQGFHAIVDPQTVAETLAAYAYERSQGNLTTARMDYELAWGCSTTITETRQAMLGVQDAIWELATGSMLLANENFVQALDLTDAEDISSEITLLQEAITLTHTAADGYLELLASGSFPDFLASQSERVDPLSGKTAPYLDVIRLAMAVAKKSRAYLEIADRQFRTGNQEQAGQTLQEAKSQAYVELVLLQELWDGIVAEPSYQEITRNMADMDRLYEFIFEGKNALGYSADFVPLYYQPGTENNNYEETKLKADSYQIAADSAIDTAALQSQLVDDDYALMQTRYAEILSEYNDELENLCGLDAEDEIDLQHCAGGQLRQQILAVEGAFLRADRVLQEMENLHRQIQIQVEARAAAAGIYDATAALIDPQTSAAYTSMVEQEEQLSGFQAFWKGFSTTINGFLGGAKGGSAFGPEGAVAGGIFGMLDSSLNLFGVTSEGPSKEEKLLQFQAWQDAQVLICEGQITDLEFETRIKELFLGFGLLDIDLLVAQNNLQQEMVRLNGMKTRVEYLLAEQAKALAFTRLLYEDPAHRVLRDYYMELAQDNYDIALEYAFQAGRALEYETNQTANEIDAPDPDGLVGIRNINTLATRLVQMQAAYDSWTQGKIPDDYLDAVSLSRALGFADMEIPGVGWVTREELFNAFVRDPSNRVDLDGDSIAESLSFNFYTSIHKGNPFFLTSVFNDRIKSVKIRVRGSNLGDDQVYVNLVWGGAQCRNSNCGSSIMRTENAFHSGGEDNLRAYNLQSRTAVVKAVAGEGAFPADAENEGLAMLSVANSSWTLTIDMTQGPNAGFNLDGIDEIELEIWHNAYPLQSISNLQEHTPRLARPYRPMENVLDPGIWQPAIQTHEDGYQTTSASATTMTGAYAGIAVANLPAHLPSIDLGIELTESTGGLLSGYLDGLLGLNFPVTDPVTGHGPQVSGLRDGDSFTLESEPFTTVITSGLTVTHQVFLDMGVITSTGELLTGQYRETLSGMSPAAMEVSGVFTMTRAVGLLSPVADFTAFPASGAPPLTVQFNDLSSNNPTSWVWTFGDGGTSNEQHPVHVYAEEGTYSVSLTVTNPYGSDTRVEAERILVYSPRLFLPLISRQTPSR